MNTPTIQFIPYNQAPDGTKDNGSILETTKKYLYHWPLFVSAIILCLAFAFVYIRYADRIYDVKARLLFKNEEDGDGGRESALQELDIVRGNKVVENEMEILKSRILMENVVNGLGLWISYKSLWI
jgi:tyrosine-protein kinase Etk/Wzc